MSKVYLVSSGEYSDYDIHGVFSTREAAQACIDRRAHFGAGYESGDIEEWELDVPLERQPGCHQCYVNLEGEVFKTSKSDYHSADEPAFHFTNSGGGFVGYGKTPEHAKRSALESWREWKAFAKADA